MFFTTHRYLKRLAWKVNIKYYRPSVFKEAKIKTAHKLCRRQGKRPIDVRIIKGRRIFKQFLDSKHRFF